MSSPVPVSRDDAIRFLESGFRNIDLPPLDKRDLSDIQQALGDLVSRLSASNEGKQA